MNCCDYCGKKLRKCKKVDIPDRTTHFKCLDKINQERYNEQMNKLKKLMRDGINKINMDFAGNLVEKDLEI